MVFFSRAVINRVVINSLFFVALMYAFEAGAAEDDYLKMLEGEAEEVTLDQSGQLHEESLDTDDSTKDLTKKNWKWKGKLVDNVVPPGLEQDEFATVLKDSFYGSFVFYRKLNSNDRQTVYYHYSQATAAHIDGIRKDILDHLKNN
jgi:hypothetical protein